MSMSSKLFHINNGMGTVLFALLSRLCEIQAERSWIDIRFLSVECEKWFSMTRGNWFNLLYCGCFFFTRVSNLCFTNLYVRTERWRLFTFSFVRNECVPIRKKKFDDKEMFYLKRVFIPLFLFSVCIKAVSQHVLER